MIGKEYRTVVPIKGLIVRDPRTKAILPETPTTVPWIGPEGRYWRRRLRDGSIKFAKHPPKVKSGEVEKKFYGEDKK